MSMGNRLPVGADQAGAAQHAGLGTQLIQQAEQLPASRDSSAWRSSPRWARVCIT